MVGKACASRLQKEYRALTKNPLPHIEAHPSPNSILDWHYVLTGPAESPYEGGVYHGKVIFPAEYPFKAPNVVMSTPSGRFEPNAKICMSMTAFHPESWNPSWSVGTILTGLLSFMLEEAPTTGSITSTPEQKRQLAAESLDVNCQNLQFRRLFPAWVGEAERRKQGKGSVRSHGCSPPPAASPAVLEQQPEAAASGLPLLLALAAALVACLAALLLYNIKLPHG